MHQLKKQKQEEMLQNFSAVKVLEIQKAEKNFKHEATKHHVKNKDKNNRQGLLSLSKTPIIFPEI